MNWGSLRHEPPGQYGVEDSVAYLLSTHYVMARFQALSHLIWGQSSDVWTIGQISQVKNPIQVAADLDLLRIMGSP